MNDFQRHAAINEQFLQQQQQQQILQQQQYLNNNSVMQEQQQRYLSSNDVNVNNLNFINNSNNNSGNGNSSGVISAVRDCNGGIIAARNNGTQQNQQSFIMHDQRSQSSGPLPYYVPSNTSPLMQQQAMLQRNSPHLTSQQQQQQRPLGVSPQLLHQQQQHSTPPPQGSLMIGTMAHHNSPGVVAQLPLAAGATARQYATQYVASSANAVYGSTQRTPQQQQQAQPLQQQMMISAQAQMASNYSSQKVVQGQQTVVVSQSQLSHQPQQIRYAYIQNADGSVQQQTIATNRTVQVVQQPQVRYGTPQPQSSQQYGVVVSSPMAIQQQQSQQHVQQVQQVHYAQQQQQQMTGSQPRSYIVLPSGQQAQIISANAVLTGQRNQSNIQQVQYTNAQQTQPASAAATAIYISNNEVPSQVQSQQQQQAQFIGYQQAQQTMQPTQVQSQYITQSQSSQSAPPQQQQQSPQDGVQIVGGTTDGINYQVYQPAAVGAVTQAIVIAGQDGASNGCSQQLQYVTPPSIPQHQISTGPVSIPKSRSPNKGGKSAKNAPWKGAPTPNAAAGGVAPSPTTTGALSAEDGGYGATIANPTIDESTIAAKYPSELLEAAAAHVTLMERADLDRLLKTIDENSVFEDEATSAIGQLMDEFVDDIVGATVRLTRHRIGTIASAANNAPVRIEARDVRETLKRQFHITTIDPEAREFSMTSRGSAVDKMKWRRVALHEQRLALIHRALKH